MNIKKIDEDLENEKRRLYNTVFYAQNPMIKALETATERIQEAMHAMDISETTFE